MIEGKDLIIDCDYLIYSAGWSGVERYYVMRGKQYKYKKDALLYGTEDELQSVVEPAPLSNILHNVRNSIDSILSRLAPVNSFKGFLTGKNNFREKIATIQPYKGNRSPDSRPPFYDEIRQYLQDAYNAEVVDGMEADDKISIEFCRKPQSIVVAVDKDYDQLPHLNVYNPKKKEMRHITPLEAHRNYYKQVLTGDSVDAILGIPGLGKKTAEKLIDPLICPLMMEQVCYIQYQKMYGPKGWDNFVENATLLYLLRSEDDKWQPKVKR